MEGRCQCSTITFTTPTPKPLALYICHCTECRHQSSSTYGMTAIFPHFTIPPPHSGAISVYTRLNTQGVTKGYFCSNCGCRLMHVSVDREGKEASMVSVKSGCLDRVDREMLRSAVHIWTRSAIVDVPEGAEQYEEEPPGGSFKEA